MSDNSKTGIQWALLMAYFVMFEVTTDMYSYVRIFIAIVFLGPFFFCLWQFSKSDETNGGYFAKLIIGAGLIQFLGFLTLSLIVIAYNKWSMAWLIAALFSGTAWYHFFKYRVKAPAISEGDLTDHGSASWSNKDEFSKGQIQKSGVYIGDGGLRGKSGHLVTVAGSGQGKGTCLIIPTLLVNPNGSYIVTDPKGENAFITARFQKYAGQTVYIIDPWNEQEKFGATHGIPSSGFNPFAYIKKDMSELRDNCELIATYLVPDNPALNDPFWNERARGMIKLFLMHIVTSLPETDHNFWTLYKMVRYSGDEWLNLLIDIKQNDAEDGLIAMGGSELIGIEKSEKTMASIRSAAQNATTIFESPQIRKSLASDEFDPYQLSNTNCTVYIVIPERNLDMYAVWLRLVIGLSLKACNSKPKNRVTFLLDEFAVLGKMKDIQRGFAFARGQNIVLWIFVQSLSQLKDIYGEDGMNTFISNAAVFQAFGVKDQYTTEYVSKMLGEGTFVKTSESVTSGDSSSSSSISKQTFGRRLLTPHEVEVSPYIITISEGHRILINKIPYYKSRYEGETAIELAKRMKFNKEYLKKNGHEPMEWYVSFKKRADPRPIVLE